MHMVSRRTMHINDESTAALPNSESLSEPSHFDNVDTDVHGETQHMHMVSRPSGAFVGRLIFFDGTLGRTMVMVQTYNGWVVKKQ